MQTRITCSTILRGLRYDGEGSFGTHYQNPKSDRLSENKIDALIEQAENTSARLTGMPHNPRSDSSPMASAICRKVDLEIEITKLAEERKALIAKIDLLENDDLSRLLILRYVQETPWDDIAAEMDFCERHIYRLHKAAVEELDNRLKDVM